MTPSARWRLCCVVLLLGCIAASASPPPTAPLADGGFITTWSVRALKGRHRQAATVAQPGEMFDLRAAMGRRFRRVDHELTARLVVPAQVDALFKLGCSRRCALFVDGKRLGTRDVRHGAHVDDAVFPLSLSAGAHDVRVRVTPRARGRRPQHVVLRVHSSDHLPIEGAHLQLPVDTEAERLLAQRTSVRFEPSMEGERLRVTAHLSAASTMPAIQAVLEAGGTRNAVSFGGGMVSVAVDVPASSKSTKVRLSLLDGETVLRTETHRIRSPQVGLEALALGTRVLARRAAGLDDGWDTLEWAVDHLLRLLFNADSDGRWIKARAGAVTRLAEGLNRGEDPLASETGVVLRAYRSTLDGRLQPYALYIPTSHRPGDALPLVVSLHPSGFHPLLALRIAMGSTGGGGKRARTRHHPTYRDRKTFVVAPYGYRGTGSRYFGKVDVLHVIDRVADRYRTARDKVTLTGGSLGGLGSFHLGLRMPDRFNAIMPIAGYGSVRFYGDVAGKKRAPWEPFLIDRRDNATFAENGRHLYMHCVHGEQDDPRRSEVIVNRYRSYRYRHRYDLLEGVGHNAWDDGYDKGAVFRLNRRHRTPRRPRRVEFVSGSYRHRSAYWVRIEQFDDHAALSRVRGRLKPDGMYVTTENVRRLSLERSGERLELDGQVFPEGIGWMSYARSRDGWRSVDDPSPPAGEKRPGVSGPLDDILYEPHVFVFGTQDPGQTDTNRRRAEEAARYYWNSAEIHVPVLPDHALTPAQRQSHHLVLVGSPTSNSVLAEMASQLPIQFDATGLTFRGQRYEGASVGTSFIYPNPLTGGRTYVKVHAGVTWRGTWLSGYLPRWGPDVLIYDEGIAVQRFGRLMDRRRPLFGGYFDRVWQ